MHKILVADDEKSVRMSIRELLGKEEYEVMDALNADESVELARREDPHVILLDIKIPDIHGLEALEVVRRENKTLRIIMCSALDKLKEDFAISSSNISAFLTKSVDVGKLKEALEKFSRTAAVLKTDLCG